jgi:hypothetical protein
MRSKTATALAIAVVAVAAFADAASASLPPKKPLLLDLQRPSIGTVGLADPAIKFSFAWAPPDRGNRSQDPVIPESYQSWRNPPAPPWAIVTFSADDQQHATAIFYRGSFRTTKGDTNGTPLATVMKHWPTHASVEPYLPLPTSPPSYQRMKIGSAYLYFNAKNLLVAVQLGDGTASLWMNEKR